MNETLIAERLADPNVKLVAVTKKHTAEEVDELYRLGVRTFGENRVQEFLEKYNPDYDWHIIGHLQTNKVKYVVGKVSMIESLDSEKLAREIEKQAAKNGIVQDILIEVRVSKSDENKTGLPPEQLDDLLALCDTLAHVRVRGLMTIASNHVDESVNAAEFDFMKKLFDSHKTDRKDFDYLSMGMSSDYALAIEHGSNMVRIGTALFENA